MTRSQLIKKVRQWHILPNRLTRIAKSIPQKQKGNKK